MLGEGDADAPEDQVVHVPHQERFPVPQPHDGGHHGDHPPNKHRALPSLHWRRVLRITP